MRARIKLKRDPHINCAQHKRQRDMTIDIRDAYGSKLGEIRDSDIWDVYGKKLGCVSSLRG
jgi:hypothetical protein